jgi:hypothetical protein
VDVVEISLCGLNESGHADCVTWFLLWGAWGGILCEYDVVFSQINDLRDAIPHHTTDSNTVTIFLSQNSRKNKLGV